MTSAADTLNIARSYLGLAESPPGSNHNVITEKFADNGGPGWEWCRRTQPWCDMFFSVCETEAGDSMQEAGCLASVDAYQRGVNGRRWLGKPDIAEIRPGDQVFFGPRGGSHTGRVEAVGSSAVTTIEGNIGDAVRREIRFYSGGSMSIYGFGRPNYDEGTVPGSPPSATEGRPILRLGSRGEGVKTWQLIVGVNVDGDFGAATDTATKVFQTKIGVTADGEVGPATWAATDRLLAYLAAASAGGGQPAPKPGAPDFMGTTRKGTGNHPVTMLVQAHLNDLGYNAGAVDGIFGAGTDAAVRHFQGDHGLARDGVVGPQTWSALWTA